MLTWRWVTIPAVNGEKKSDPFWERDTEVREFVLIDKATGEETVHERYYEAAGVAAERLKGVQLR